VKRINRRVTETKERENTRKTITNFKKIVKEKNNIATKYKVQSKRDN
jgi:hypothetical protein